jgi:hypothetical protein
MTDKEVEQNQELKILVDRLHSIDLDALSDNPDLKREALSLARKITGTLEGPVNRATDLVFKVCRIQ